MIGLGMKIYPHEFQGFSTYAIPLKAPKIVFNMLGCKACDAAWFIVYIDGVVDVELLEDELLERAFLAADVIGSLDVAIPRLSLLDGASPKKS